MKSKAVFLDVDGTLILNSHEPFPEDIKAIEEASARGHLFFLNTGRSYANIPYPLLDLPYLRGVSAGGGAHVLMATLSGTAPISYETIYHNWLSDEVIALTFEVYGKQQKRVILEGERFCYYISPVALVQTAKTIRAYKRVRTLEEFQDLSQGDRVTKLTLEGPINDEESRHFDPHLTVNRFATYTELIIKGENKAKGMDTILSQLGMNRQDSIAIGDSANDLDMIRHAGLGIAMGNAPPEIQAAADTVTAACGDGGVAKAIRKHLVIHHRQ